MIQIWIELTEIPGAMRAFEAFQKKILDEGAIHREAELCVQKAKAKRERTSH